MYPGLRGALFYAAFWGADGLYEPFLTVYFLSCGLGGEQIGWLAAILPFCTMAIAPLVTRLADHLQRRVVMLALVCLGFGAALTLPALPFFRPSFLVLAGFVALFSIFRGPIVSLADSLIASMAARRSLEFGSMRLWGSLIFTLTATSLGALWQHTGYPKMFLFTGLAFLPVILIALLLEEAPRAEAAAINQPAAVNQPAAINQPAAVNQAADPGERAPGRPGLVLDAGLLCLLSATFLVVAALFMAGTFGPVYMTQLGGGAAMVGALNGIAALGEVPGMRFGSRVARRLGNTNVLLAAYALIALGLVGTGLARVPWLLLVFALVRGIGFGQMLVSTVTIINNQAPPGYTSTYQGILQSACWGLAPLLGGPISGWIFQSLGPTSLFLTAAAITAVSMALITPTYRLWKVKGGSMMDLPPQVG